MVNEKANNIREMLNNGDSVTLICVNKEGFAPFPNSYNDEILRLGELGVSLVTESGGVVLKNGLTITKAELRFFEIKEKELTLDDLIDVIAKALKDGVEFGSVEFIRNGLLFDRFHDDVILPSDKYGIEKAIEWIESLYTETFVFESKEDWDRIARLPVESIVLANGEDIISDVWIDEEDALRWRGIGQLVKFKVMKGATVTQRRVNG